MIGDLRGDNARAFTDVMNEVWGSTLISQLRSH